MIDIWEVIKSIVNKYVFYYIVFIFIATTISYLTYRFWKYIIPKEEEKDIFITNAPLIWSNRNNENTKELIIETIEEYMKNNNK